MNRLQIKRYKCETPQSLFVVMMCCCALFFWVGAFWSVNGAQYDIFFDRGGDMFADYLNVVTMSRDGNPYLFGVDTAANAERAYPPLAYLIFQFLSHFAIRPKEGILRWYTNALTLLFCIFTIVSWCVLLGIAFYHTAAGGKKQKAILTILMFQSSIFLFAVERGNIILLTAVCVNIFLLFYDSESPKKREIAYICLALAAGIKVYPAVLGLLVLKQHKPKEVLRLMLYGTIAIFVPFLFIKGGFDNIPQLLTNLKVSSATYETAGGERFGYQFFIPYVKGGLQNPLIQAMKYLIRALGILSIPLALFENRHWRVTTLLVLTIMIFPTNDAKYNGLYLLLCLLLFLKEERRLSTQNIIVTMLFLLILQPFQSGCLENGMRVSSLLFSTAATILWVLLIFQAAGQMMVWFRKHKGDSTEWSRKNDSSIRFL